MGFPERLKELREKAGLSQEDLADKLGVPRSSISHYERTDLPEEEQRTPRRDRLKKIADFFDIQIDYLLGRTNDPSPSNKKVVPNDQANVFYREWDKLTPERRQQAIDYLKYLNQLTDEENNKKK